MFAAFRIVSYVFATSLTIARLHALDLTPEPGFRERNPVILVYVHSGS